MHIEQNIWQILDVSLFHYRGQVQYQWAAVEAVLWPLQGQSLEHGRIEFLLLLGRLYQGSTNRPVPYHMRLKFFCCELWIPAFNGNLFQKKVCFGFEVWVLCKEVFCYGIGTITSDKMFLVKWFWMSIPNNIHCKRTDYTRFNQTFVNLVVFRSFFISCEVLKLGKIWIRLGQGLSDSRVRLW